MEIEILYLLHFDYTRNALFRSASLEKANRFQISLLRYGEFDESGGLRRCHKSHLRMCCLCTFQTLLKGRNLQTVKFTL